MKKNRKRRSNNITKVGVLLFTLLFSEKIFAEEVEEKKKVFQIEDSSIKNPLELRDPFKKKRVRGKKKVSTYKTILVDNTFNNLPNISNSPVESITIVGILLGKKRVAMAKVATNPQIYMLKEGMKIGPYKSEVKAILPGGVVIVEKIRNIYEQDEYIETVIPFSGGG